MLLCPHNIFEREPRVKYVLEEVCWRPSRWRFCVTIYDPLIQVFTLDFPGGADGKASAYKAGDPGSIPESGSSPGEGNGNPLQYSCLENPMDGGAWRATFRGVSESQTQLSDCTFFSLSAWSVILLLVLKCMVACSGQSLAVWSLINYLIFSLVKREHRNKWYCPLSNSWRAVISYLVLFFLCPLLFILI